MTRRRGRPRDPDQLEHQPRTYKPRRQRSRDMDWETQRQFAQTVKCPPAPKGCGAPIGRTCRNQRGEELINQPAHDKRMRLARQAEPAAGDPAPVTQEELRP